MIRRIKWYLYKLLFAGERILSNLQYYFSLIGSENVNGITMVVVGRNDNYGGDFTLRLKTTLDWNIKHLPNVELIYIEWNHIKDRPSDCEWIVKAYPNTKCYIVPEEIHRQVAAQPDKMKVMEYFGKNIGIRKATNDWIMLINSDVVLAADTLRKLRRLNRKAIYGTHYRTITWDSKPINEGHFIKKHLIKMQFSAYSGFPSAVGNFILAHKSSWLEATGYDESLRNSRLGVDANGYFQLKSFGLKNVVLGFHYHLDHPESVVNINNVNHGDTSVIRDRQNIPYKNKDDWGFISYPVKKINDNIWELVPL